MHNPSPGSSASAQNPSWMNTSLSPHERANLLLAQMTLEEKIEMVHGEFPAPYRILQRADPAVRHPGADYGRRPGWYSRRQTGCQRWKGYCHACSHRAGGNMG